MNLPKIAYSMLGLPSSYYGMTFENTKLSPVKAQAVTSKLEKAPASGVLLISGTAGPVVNRLIISGRKTVGLNFSDYYQSKLSNEESMDVPRGSVVLIYGIGTEPANSSQFAAKLLGSLLGGYKSSLVILETDKTPSNFQTTYSLVIANTLSIPEMDVERWV